MHKKNLLLILGIILVVFIVEHIFSATVLAEKLELKSYDFRIKISKFLGTYRNKLRNTDKKIVIVSIDDNSREEYLKSEGLDIGSWPWPRDTWSEVINFIEAGDPKAILFDMAFDRMDDNHWNDRRLAQVMRKYDNIVLGTYLYNKTPEETEAVKNNVLPTNNPLTVRIDNKKIDNAITFNYNSPVPEIYSRYNTMGVANMVTDIDFVVRKTRPVYKVVKNDKIYYMPSLAFAGFMKYLGDEDNVIIENNKILYKGRVIPINNNGLTNISWHGQERDYSYVPVSKILLSERNEKYIKSKFFKDKVVIIGRTNRFQDLHLRILSPAYSGPEANAAALDNFINDTDLKNNVSKKFISKIQILPEYLLITLICALVCFVALLSKTALIGLINSTVLMFLYLSFCIWTFVNPQSKTWIPIVIPFYYLIATTGIIFAYRFSKELKQRANLREIFGRLVSSDILKTILKNPDSIALTSAKKHISVMSCAVNDFAGLTKKHNPEIVTETLNGFFDEVVKIITDNNGTVDKIVGGQITAYWGAPVPSAEDASNSVKAALEIKKKVNELKIANTKENKIIFGVTTGINTGEAIIGLSGPENMKTYSAIGDCVKLAARLSKSCITLKRDILISKATFEEAKENIIAIEVGKLTVKGYIEQIEVYEPINVKAD